MNYVTLLRWFVWVWFRSQVLQDLSETLPGLIDWLATADSDIVHGFATFIDAFTVYRRAYNHSAYHEIVLKEHRSIVMHWLMEVSERPRPSCRESFRPSCYLVWFLCCVWRRQPSRFHHPVDRCIVIRQACSVVVQWLVCVRIEPEHTSKCSWLRTKHFFLHTGNTASSHRFIHLRWRLCVACINLNFSVVSCSWHSGLNARYWSDLQFRVAQPCFLASGQCADMPRLDAVQYKGTRKILTVDASCCWSCRNGMLQGQCTISHVCLTVRVCWASKFVQALVYLFVIALQCMFFDHWLCHGGTRIVSWGVCADLVSNNTCIIDCCVSHTPSFDTRVASWRRVAPKHRFDNWLATRTGCRIQDVPQGWASEGLSVHWERSVTLPYVPPLVVTRYWIWLWITARRSSYGTQH